MKRTNIYLSESQHKDLTALSKKTDLSIAELVRRAIDEFLEKRRENKAPEPAAGSKK